MTHSSAHPAPPPFVEAPGLSGFTMHFRHGFFGNEGGVSKGDHASLNCGPGSSDQRDAVEENRNRVCRALGGLPGKMVTMKQVHSNRVVVIDRFVAPAEAAEADGVITQKPGLVLTALAADCAPILMADPHIGAVGAVHAGWRGAVGGVIESAVEAFIELGSDPNNIRAAVGPCLSQESFEVGPELREEVMSATPWAAPLFHPGRDDRLHFDLKRYCQARLVRAKVGKSETLDDDTLTQPDRFHSYRRMQKTGMKDYGRNASAIMLI